VFSSLKAGENGRIDQVLVLSGLLHVDALFYHFLESAEVLEGSFRGRSTWSLTVLPSFSGTWSSR